MTANRLKHIAARSITEQAGQVELGPDGGEFTDVRSEQPITDWTHVFAQFNLDPDEFTIVDDTVRMSMWQTSRRTDDGDRDVQNLYSYKARFKRRDQYTDADTLARMIDRLQGTASPKATRKAEPVSLFVGLADWQLGKSYGPGQGTAETLDRINASKAAILAYLEDRKRLGYNIEKIVLANMGDPIEGVQASYANQLYSVDLNTRDQLTLAIDTTLEWIRDFAPYAPIEYAATLCNHGQMSRGTSGKSNATDDADNASGFIGDTIRTVVSHIPGLAGTAFTIPRDNMITTVQASGVNLALAHGHKISGNEQAWLAKQTNALNHQGYRTDLWVTAHRHSASVDDYGPYRRIQCTTVDPGSKWFTDSTGVYATPGTTVFLAGGHLPFKFTDWEVL